MRTLQMLLLLLVFSWFLPKEARAQSSTSGTVTFVGQVYEASESGLTLGVPGAVVEFCWPGDTLRTLTNSGGAFSVKKVKMGKVLLRLSHVAYEPMEQEVNVHARLTLNLYTLKPKNVQMDQVTVQAKVPAFTLRGDTIVFNAAAFKTLAGDETIELVRQLPGVVVGEDGTVRVFGKEVTKTYVDGKLLFGDHPSDALNNLSADEVISIRTYDQLSPQNRMEGNLTAAKERVFDIETKHKYSFAKVAQARIGAGHDLEGDGNRYAAKGAARFFSERFSVKAGASVDNLDGINEEEQIPTDVVASDNRMSEVLLSLQGKLGKGEEDLELGPSYSLDYQNTHNRGASHVYFRQMYLPTEEYQDRVYNDSTDTWWRSTRHSLSLSYSDWSSHSLSLSSDFAYEKGSNLSLKRSLTQLNGSESFTNQDQSGRSHSYKWTGRFSRSLLSGDWGRVKLNARGNFVKGLDDGFRMDTLSSTNASKVYRTDGLGYQRNYEVSLDMSFYLNGRRKSKHTEAADSISPFEMWLAGGTVRSLDWSVTYERQNSREREIRLERSESGLYELDSLMSHDARTNYHILKNEVGFNYSGGRQQFSISLETEYARAAEDRTLYPFRQLRKHYVVWSPRVTWGLGSLLSGVSFSYVARSQLPDLNLLNDQLDDSNPLYLSTGNPNLKVAYTHSFSLSGSKMIHGTGSLDGDVTLLLRPNQMVSCSRFFADGGVLEEWNNYEMAPGTTLTTYENRNGGVSVSANVSYSTDVEPIRSSLRINSSFNFSRSVSYLNEVLCHNYGQDYGLHVNLRSNFSRNYRLVLSSYSSYQKNYATAGSLSDTFSERVGLVSENNLTDKLFVNLGGCYYRLLPLGGSGVDDHRVVLNLMAGVRLMKGRGRLTLSAYDLLQRGSTSINWQTTADYQIERWKRSNGSFWMVSFSYKFNSTAASSR